MCQQAQLSTRSAAIAASSTGARCPTASMSKIANWPHLPTNSARGVWYFPPQQPLRTSPQPSFAGGGCHIRSLTLSSPPFVRATHAHTTRPVRQPPPFPRAPRAAIRHRLTTAAETLLAAARDLGVLDLVLMGDSALRLGHCTLEELVETAAQRRRGAPKLRRAIGMLDSRSESPWESIMRVLHRAADIPVEAPARGPGPMGSLRRSRRSLDRRY
jgi:hypothetical protein